MPRNSFGVMSLEAGNPVVSDTVIETSWANPTLDDIANELTGSVPCDGSKGMTAALKGADGTELSPMYTFTNATGMGMWKNSTSLSFSVGGVAKLTLPASGGVSFGAGTVSLPALGFGDTDTGFYAPAAGSVAVASNGVIVQSWGIGQSSYVMTQFGVNNSGSFNAYDTLRVGGTFNASATLAYGINVQGTVPATASGVYSSFTSQPTTVASATVFSEFHHFDAFSPALGAGSSITISTGFHARDQTNSTYGIGFRSAQLAGTNKFCMYMDGSAQNYIEGRLSVGGLPGSDSKLQVTGNLTGSTISKSILVGSTGQSDVTNYQISFQSAPATQATSYTLSHMDHVYISNVTKGAGSTITEQTGLVVSDLTSGTTNIAVDAQITSGSNKWNFYASGSANNAFAGSTRFGSTVAPTATVDITGSLIASGNITGSSFVNTNPESGRNSLINGGMEAWQRGTSIAVAASVNTTAGYGPDRWCLATNANQASVISQQTGITTTSQFAVKVLRNSGQTGTGVMTFEQAFELNNIFLLRGQIVTLSFTAKAGANWSPASGTLSWGLYCGTGAAARRNTVAYTSETTPISSSSNITTTATRYTATSSAIAVSTTQMSLMFSWTPVGTAGADDSFYLDDVQIEIAPSASAFENIPYDNNLLRCQRYYSKSYSPSTAPGSVSNIGAFRSTADAGTVISVNVRYPVQMRTIPTTTVYSPSTGASGKMRNETTAADVTAVVNATYSNENSMHFGVGLAAASQVGTVQFAADAEL